MWTVGETFHFSGASGFFLIRYKKHIQTDDMPYSCTTPYNRDTATKRERIKSCTKSASGAFKDLTTCSERCYIGGPGREKTRGIAATRVQTAVRAKRARKEADARRAAKAASQKTKGPKKAAPKKAAPKKVKSACAGRKLGQCKTPCKWASGAKRSFCRTMKNRTKVR